MPMLSRQNERLLRSLIAKHRLEFAENVIVEQAAECGQLIRGNREDYSIVGNSRYGGVPDLPPSIPWPCFIDCYLDFLMQINLREVPSIAGSPLPKSGMLYFFLASDDDGSDVVAQVIFFNGRRSSLRRATPPSNDQRCQSDYQHLVPYKMTIACCLDVPKYFSKIADQVRQPDESDGIDDLGDQLLKLSEDAGWKKSSRRNNRDSRKLGQLLGCIPLGYGGDDLREYAFLRSIRMSRRMYDSRYKKCNEKKLREGANEWRLLWRLASDVKVGVSIHDSGEFNVLIRSADLVRHNFSNIYVEVESG